MSCYQCIRRKRTNITTNIGKNRKQLKFNYPDNVRKWAVDERRAVHLARSLKSWVVSQTLTDVVLIVDGQRFPCHKCVMSHCCPYFQTMFSTKLDVSKQEEVKIEGITSEAMSLIIDFAYAQEIKLKKENVEDVFAASHLFQVEYLQNMCEEFMQKNVDESNCINIYFFSTLYSLPNLKNPSLPIIRKSLSKLYKTTDFLELTDIGEIVKSDSLHSVSEEKLLDVIIKWVEHDVETRNVFIVSLFQNVHLHLIPYFEDLKDIPLLAANDACLKIIRKEMSICLKSSLNLPPEETKNLKSELLYEDVLIYINYDNRINVQKLEATNITHYKIIPPFRRNKYTLVVTEEDEIFAIGGLDHCFLHNFVEIYGTFCCYKKPLGTWAKCTPSHEKHNDISSFVSLSRYIYALGTGEYANCVERYDIKHDRWNFVAPLPTSLYASSTAIAYRGKIYLLMPPTRVQCFDPVSNSWSFSVPYMPMELVKPDTIVFEDLLYCFGLNANDRRELAALVFIDNAWKQVSSLPLLNPKVTSLVHIAKVYQGSLHLFHWTTSQLEVFFYEPIYFLNSYKYQVDQDCWIEQIRLRANHLPFGEETQVFSSKMNPFYMDFVERLHT